jgi:hypothetical protein
VDWSSFEATDLVSSEASVASEGAHVQSDSPDATGPPVVDWSSFEVTILLWVFFCLLFFDYFIIIIIIIIIIILHLKLAM